MAASSREKGLSKWGASRYGCSKLRLREDGVGGSEDGSSEQWSSEKGSVREEAWRNSSRSSSGGGVLLLGELRNDQVWCGLRGMGEALGVVQTATNMSPRRLGKVAKGMVWVAEKRSVDLEENECGV